ncbi:carbohydrate-binding protein [Streptomyces sp. WZ-12]|uniref:carbohydrate-binding protein n=1 Tax=Streptomyces sp. WZ-12 TaxID=3030210 RepID=UPI002380D792|nr:carbohydrate-binding protein [Streptomyces sp. WZ-12]
MAVYGLDFYSMSKYGMDIPVDYTVEPFTAVPTAPGAVHLQWSPSKEDTWTTLRLVRNPLGLPGDADDGDTLLETGHEGLVASHLDTGLTQGRPYYYSVFVAAPYPDWNPDTAYQPGDGVSYQGQNYVCQQANNATPGQSTAWSATTGTGTWVRAGSAATIAVGDHHYAERLYRLTPRSYRTALEEITGYEDGITNRELFTFFQILGLQLDVIKTELDNRMRIHDQRHTEITQTERAAATLGVEPALSERPALRRNRVRNATKANRAKGSMPGLRQVIRDMTGWDCRIEPTPNLMVDQDQSGIWHPTHQEWKPGIRYAEGEYVRYGNATYKAKGSSRTYQAAQLLPPAAVSSKGTVRRQVSQGERAFAQGFQKGDAFTLEFDVATAGEYDASAIYTTATDYATWDTELDGVKVHTGFGGYSAYIMPAGVSLGRWTLTAGTHQLRFVSTGKDAASGGYQMGVNSWTIVPVGTLRAADVPPQGHVDSSLFWSQEMPPRDWALERNPVTLDPSTWWVLKDSTMARLPTGGLGIQTGMPPAVTTGYANTALTFTAPEDQQSYSIASVASAQIRSWNPRTDYVIGNLVSWNGSTWEATATVGEGQEPGRSQSHWRPSLMTADRSNADSSLVASYGVPLPRLYDWSPNTPYAPGDTVIYGRYRYEAVLPSAGERPSGGPRDNRCWSYAGTNIETVTASAYLRNADGKPLSSIAVDLWWYDQDAAYMTWNSHWTIDACVLDRFDTDQPTLDATPTGTAPTKWRTGGGTWEAVDGIARATPSKADDGTYCTYSIFEPQALAGAALGSVPFNISATVMSAPPDPLARQGLVLCTKDDMAAFTLAGRDGVYRYVLTNGRYTATSLGTYPAFKDGERITACFHKEAIVIKKSSGVGYQMQDLLAIRNPEITGHHVGFAEIKVQTP